MPRLPKATRGVYSTSDLGHGFIQLPPRGVKPAAINGYAPGVYVLPKLLDEKVARLQLNKLDAELTVLTQEQADYIGVPVEGPYKAEQYRY